MTEINYEVERQDLEGQKVLSGEVSRSMEGRNGLVGVQGKWRKQPYASREYERIAKYEPAG